MESESSPVSSFAAPRQLPGHVEYEDDSEESVESIPPPAVEVFTASRRRATDNNKIAVAAAPLSTADEGDFILRRESDFGLRRNVARNSDSQRSGDVGAVREASGANAGGGSERVRLDQLEPVSTGQSRSSLRTGLPTSRRVTARQRDSSDVTAAAFSGREDLSTRAEEEDFSVGEPPVREFGGVSAASGTTRPATVMRQRLRQEPLRTVAADEEEEPSARAAAAEGRSSSRARSQFQRMRTVLPPESPLAVALPRSGHSTNVDTSASQQVNSTLSLDCKNWSLISILRDKSNFMINLTRCVLYIQ